MSGKKVDSVLMFPNGQLAVFSEGKQVPELQVNVIELIGKQAESIGFDIEGAELRTGIYMGKVIKEDDGRYNWTV